VKRLSYANNTSEHIALPFQGTVGFLSTDPRLLGAFIYLTTWTQSPRWYRYTPENKKITDSGLQPASPVDFSGYEALEVKARSADGTMVPLSIILQKGLPRDGSHPTLLGGYGAYGISSLPIFDPKRLAWMERGGIYAIAHVRGGGEYGEDWHLAGWKKTKMNTIDDFIACAEYLIAQKFTSPSKLAGTGTSAGGILIGRAITKRPDLFAAAVSRVGASNPLRFEVTQGGPANVPEFGTVTIREEFEGLRAMDPYANVASNTRYPAVLLTAGINDPRVPPWQPGKMAARLQSATTSGKPVLLRVEFDAGHGIGSTRSQLREELADTYSFLMWQFGQPDYQPPATTVGSR
jgi:prolyl oligopeptidase